MDGLTILIDSNIFIALEDIGISNDAHSPAAAQFASLASKLGARIVVCAGTRIDISRTLGTKRQVRQKQLDRYFVLEPISRDPILAHRAGFPPVRSPNDEVDLELLMALASGAADWLVTQDSQLRKRAVRAGFSERIFSLHEILETLNQLVNKPSGLITVETVAGYQINLNSPIFESLREDYKEFNEWWEEKVAREHRDVLVLGSKTDPEGLAVLKIEADLPHAIPGRVLKICTFKTSDAFHGSKRGELLLRAAIDYARVNNCERVYLEVLPGKETLLNWLSRFGFRIAKQSATIRGEHVVVKNLVPPAKTDELSALEFNVAYGPGALRVERIHFVPIQPRYHRRLFPDAEKQQSLFARSEACGNSIRKAYLCHAKIRSIQAGDILLFVRTGGNSIVTAAGVAEATCVSQLPEEIAAFVGSRTVYSIDEIRSLCEKGDILAVLFRLDRILSRPWPLLELKTAGILRGSTQSIQSVRGEAIAWIRQRLAG